MQSQKIIRTPEAIRQGLAGLAAGMPHLKPVLDAFGGVLLAEAELADRPVSAEAAGPAVDPARFAAGVPAVPRDTLQLERKDILDVLDALLPALEKGFPAIRSALEDIGRAMRDGLDAAPLASAFLAGRDEELEQDFRRLGLDPAVGRFVLFRLVRPLARRIALATAPAIEGLTWTKGNCPVCGSQPSMGFIAEKDGQRRLVCSLCGHDWVFRRTECPFCDSADLSAMEAVFIEGRTQERAEACGKCGHYLVQLDARSLSEPFVPELAALAMLPLDILAQEKEFIPGGEGWMLVGPQGQD
jgi:FdhE protein